MGLEVVVNEILARGGEEERSILAAAEAERQRLVDAAEGEADELRARILQETRQRVEALQREQRSASEFEVRRRILTTQRELTEDFRARVLDALAKLPKPERERLHGILVHKVRAELPQGRVHARKDDLAHVAAASGYEKGHELACVGGLQAENPEGTILLDSRFETLLENVWKEVLASTRSLYEG